MNTLASISTLYISFSLCVHIYQADSFKMVPELVKNVDSLEHLLGLSEDDRASVGQNSKARGEIQDGQGLLIGKGSAESRAGDRVHQFLSSVNSCGRSLDTLPR